MYTIIFTIAGVSELQLVRCDFQNFIYKLEELRKDTNVRSIISTDPSGDFEIIQGSVFQQITNDFLGEADIDLSVDPDPLDQCDFEG